MRSYLENTQYKTRAGGVTQAVARLPSKHEVLSSNPNTAKKKRLVGELLQK
jgi:hypothetical protein